MNSLYYTGVGSRETPTEICKKMEAIAAALSKKGYILRSGHAAGADLSFERKATNKEIWLPYNGFNKQKVDNKSYFLPLMESFELAENIHPAWDRCNTFAKQCHARNCHQVLGKDLNTPSKFLICWTKQGKEIGGTATAIRLAKIYNVPVFNLATVEDIIIINFIKSLL